MLFTMTVKNNQYIVDRPTPSTIDLNKNNKKKSNNQICFIASPTEDDDIGDADDENTLDSDNETSEESDQEEQTSNDDSSDDNSSQQEQEDDDLNEYTTTDVETFDSTNVSNTANGDNIAINNQPSPNIIKRCNHKHDTETSVYEKVYHHRFLHPSATILKVIGYNGDFPDAPKLKNPTVRQEFGCSVRCAYGRLRRKNRKSGKVPAR